MIKLASSCLLSLLISSCATTNPLTKLSGEWEGELEYKDYQRPDRRVTLPTLLSARERGPDEAVLDFSFDDGPGKTVLSHDVMSLDAAKKEVRWGDLEWPLSQRQLFRVVTQTNTTFVLEADGEDDDMPALIRETFTFEGDALTIVKMVKPTLGELTFRHEYRLKRKRPAAKESSERQR